MTTQWLADRLAGARWHFKKLWNRVCPGIPLPIRLPFGSWWLAVNDFCSDSIFAGRFECSECRFVERFLQPGMTVLDVGAHHGFYTLLASTKVGATGKVITFEPSPRERIRLVRHLRLNHRTNVTVLPWALAEHDGYENLNVVAGRDTGCNSLRPPFVSEPTYLVQVEGKSLDSCIPATTQVDFMKMDVEGAELGVLRGATQLLTRRPRPVILCEVSDTRTRPWGYSSGEIVDYLAKLEFRWFGIDTAGRVIDVPSSGEGNLLAIPKETM